MFADMQLLSPFSFFFLDSTFVTFVANESYCGHLASHSGI